MRRSWQTGWVLVLASCVAPSGPLGKLGQVEGTLELPAAARGDAYAFLYPRGEGPPGGPAQPSFATGISDARLSGGDTDYVFAGVPPNPYNLWAFLDPNRTVRDSVDVLVQPGAGGRESTGAELNLEPGQDLTVDVPLDHLVPLEPPAFELAGTAATNFEIPDAPGAVVTFTLQSTDLGFLQGEHLGFSVSLPDAGDPLATTNSFGLPTLYPQVFLRFVPKPGQTVPTDSHGNPDQVIVPFAFNYGPYLLALGGDSTKAIIEPSLTVAMLPQAQALATPPGGKPTVTALSAIPVGDYELWVLQKSGQFWHIPNDLAVTSDPSLGGPFPTQGVRFQVVHGSSFDAGS